MGSITPKKTSPIPMPVANSIEVQPTKEYSGFASWPPITTLPMGEKIRNRLNSTKRLAAPMKSQSKVEVSQPRMPLSAASVGPACSRAKITKAAITATEMGKTG